MWTVCVTFTRPRRNKLETETVAGNGGLITSERKLFTAPAFSFWQIVAVAARRQQFYGFKTNFAVLIRPPLGARTTHTLLPPQCQRVCARPTTKLLLLFIINLSVQSDAERINDIIFFSEARRAVYTGKRRWYYFSTDWRWPGVVFRISAPRGNIVNSVGLLRGGDDTVLEIKITNEN